MFCCNHGHSHIHVRQQLEVVVVRLKSDFAYVAGAAALPSWYIAHARAVPQPIRRASHVTSTLSPERGGPRQVRPRTLGLIL